MFWHYIGLLSIKKQTIITCYWCKLSCAEKKINWNIIITIASNIIYINKLPHFKFQLLKLIFIINHARTDTLALWRLVRAAAGRRPRGVVVPRGRYLMFCCDIWMHAFNTALIDIHGILPKRMIWQHMRFHAEEICCRMYARCIRWGESHVRMNTNDDDGAYSCVLYQS